MGQAITSTNLAEAIVKIVAAQSLELLRPNLIMGNLVNRAFEAEVKNAGDTVAIPIPPVMQANNIAETGSVQAQAVSPGFANLTLDSHVEATFAIPDVTKAIAGGLDAITQYMKSAVLAVATRIESDLLGHYARFVAQTQLGTGGSPLTETTIDSAEQALFSAYIPETEPRYLVVSAQNYSDIRKISRFTENATSGQGDSVLTGQVGLVKNFRVFRSQLTPYVSGTNFNLAFTKDALGIVSRLLDKPMAGLGVISDYVEDSGFGMRVLMSYNPNSLQQQFTIDTLYGTGVLRNQCGIVVKA